MKCPECQTENPDTQKFCGDCGAKLEKICPSCSAKNPPLYKFCGECGHNLALPSEAPPKELSFDEKIDKIQRYLPKGLTEKILSQRDKIEGERKQVTVMFCDMEGFTGFAERLGPEGAYGIMDQIYEILIHKVHDSEGTVNEMTGDGIMALFGAPIALEDAPQRAIRSAMAIHREMAKFSDKIKGETEGIPPLKMRVGIHTGPVVVGTLGNDLRVEFKAVGDTVNLASRMEGLAEPGTTYVSEKTFKLTEGFFRFEALGEKAVKGKKEPVKVYRVIAPSTRRTRFDVSAERGLTQFVGRERELELLLDGFDRSKGGRGQAFSIVSDAGVGKSRLLYEFRKAVASEDVTFLEGKCLSYNRGAAYYPFIDILKSNFHIGEGDGDSEISEKVKESLKLLGVDEGLTLPYLLELLSVKESGISKISMSPEARKDRIVEALKRITLKGSEVRPLIMAFEDLHWVDKSSEQALKYLLDSIAGARVFLTFTYRPEFVHTWGGRSYHNQLTLNRLSNRESLTMVTHLLGTENLDRNLEKFVLEKTEGVPFFIEEFIRSLVDLKIIVRKDNKYYLAKDQAVVTIPSTIQDVIMARVDSVPESTKEVIQMGSVIEREFSYELIKRVAGLPEQQLLSHLSVLKDSELIYERGVFPQSTYIFKHALTREVIYDSILMKRKKKLHEKIGRAIEELYRDNIYEHHGVLARHFIEAENYEKGAKYLKLEGKRAEETGSINEAIALARKTISALEKLPRTISVQKQVVDIRTILGLRLIDMNFFNEALEAVYPITDLALKGGDKRRVSQIYTIIGGREFCVQENFPKAFEFLEEALRILDETEDIGASNAASYLGYALSLNCEFEKAFHHINKNLNLVVGANDLVRIPVMKSLLSYLVYFPRGSVNLAYQTSLEALKMSEESGDIYSNSFARACHGISCFGKGFLEEAKNHFLKGLILSKKIDHHFWSAQENYFLGEIYFEMGEYQTAKDHYEKAMRFMELIGWLPSWGILNRTAFARAKVMVKEKDFHLEPMYAEVSNNRLEQYGGLIRRYVGEILLRIDDEHQWEAEDWIMKATQLDKQNCMMFHLARDSALYAELYKRRKDLSKAEEKLREAIEIYRKCGADGWLEKTEKELASLS